MASSNRHWPSMFKSKPSCNPHHQWQHDINSSLISTHRTAPYSSGCEERSPEPKARWNPKPEQIRILEGIFNSGMVNPPREEIRKIRAQLQEYGQVGDANVFYWFQNRKSRSKHKLRQLHNSKNKNHEQQQQNMVSSGNTVISHPQITATVAPTSSSSSSEKSSPKETLPTKIFSLDVVVPNSPTASVNQTYLHPHNDAALPPPASAEAFFFPVQPPPQHHHGHQGFFFSELSNVFQAAHHQHSVGPCTSLLLSEIMSHGHGHGATISKKDHQDVKAAAHPPPHLTFSVAPPHTAATVIPTPITTTTVTIPTPLITQLQGVGDGAVATKSTVFINDVAFEVAVGPFNVREAFGDDAVLIHPTGQPVLTNQWGVTLHSLQHGASYYLI